MKRTLAARRTHSPDFLTRRFVRALRKISNSYISILFARDSNARGESSHRHFISLYLPLDASLLFFFRFLLFPSFLFFSRSQVSSARSRPILNFHHAGLPFLFVIGYPILINVSICFFVLALPFYCFPPHLATARARHRPIFILPVSAFRISRFSILPRARGYIHRADNEYSNFRRDARGEAGGVARYKNLRVMVFPIDASGNSMYRRSRRLPRNTPANV